REGLVVTGGPVVLQHQRGAAAGQDRGGRGGGGDHQPGRAALGWLRCRAARVLRAGRWLPGVARAASGWTVPGVLPLARLARLARLTRLARLAGLTRLTGRLGV